MKKYIVVGTVVCSALLLIVTSSFVFGINYTGFFKAFDKTLAPGEHYEKNITVRKFYNTTIRFQKENSTSYLSFSDESGVVVLKDSADVEIARLVGVKSGRAYVRLTNYEIASIVTISAYNISDYEDVVDQPVNGSAITFSGTTAYITIKVYYPPATIAGYVVDELTGDSLSGIKVAAFEDGADPSAADALGQSISGVDGSYLFTFDLKESKALDIYVEGYDVA